MFNIVSLKNDKLFYRAVRIKFTLEFFDKRVNKRDLLKITNLYLK